MHGRLETAVRAAGGTRIRGLTMADDHAFSASRQQLAELVTRWLNGECAASQPTATP